MINWKKPKWPIFGVKFLLRISEKKWHPINSGEILSNFCPIYFLSNLDPIWEKRVWKFRFCSFHPDNLNQHCIKLTKWLVLEKKPVLICGDEWFLKMIVELDDNEVSLSQEKNLKICYKRSSTWLIARELILHWVLTQNFWWNINWESSWKKNQNKPTWFSWQS